MNDLKDSKSRRGGARPNSGVPKGYKYAPTIAKEQAREITRQIITRHLEKLITAQLDNAQGIRHLMMRDPKTGKFERVAADSTDPKVAEAQIDAALQSGNAVWMYTKDPSVQAFTDLMNRALDKPSEQVHVSGEVNHTHTVITQKLQKSLIRAEEIIEISADSN